MTGAGTRNQLWMLESPPTVEAYNEFGEASIGGWTEEGRIWLALTTLTDIEMERAQAINRATTHRATMIFHHAIKSSWRLKRVEGDTTRYLYITGIRNPDGFRREMELSCSEVVENVIEGS